MKLSKLVEKVFGSNLENALIGIVTKPGATIEPDYADEILETHGELEVEAWQLHHPTLLLVQFKED